MKTNLSLPPAEAGSASPAKGERTADWQAGDLCSACGEAKLDFNGVFRLECPRCGFRPAESACGCSFRAEAV